MVGILDWIGGLFGPEQYGPPAPPGAGGILTDPRGIREQALYGALGQLGAGLLAAGARRPVTQPSPLPQALAGFGPAYRQGIATGQQEAALERQADQERRWNDIATGTTPIPGIPAEMLPTLRILGPQLGPQVVAQRMTRGTATPMSDAESIQIFGTTGGFRDQNGMPQLPQGPRTQGLTAAAQFGAVPHNTPPGSEWNLFTPPGAPSAAQPGQAPPTNPMGVIAPGASGNGQTAFRNFATPEDGIAAGQQAIRAIAGRIQQATGQPPTLRQIIGGVPDGRGGVVPMTAYAPAGHGQNNPDVYLRQWPNINPDAPLDVNNPQVMQALTAGIIRQEGIARPGQQQVAQAGPGGWQSQTIGRSSQPAPGTQQGRFEAQSGENSAQYLNQRVVQPAEASIGALQTAARMRAILGTGDIAAGPGSALRDYIAEVARTYGGQAGTELANRIQSADYGALRALSARSVIDALGGSLGTGISSTDRDYMATTVPNPFQSTETMQRFISLLEDRALGQIDRSLGVYARSAPNYNPQTDPFVNNLHSGLADLGIDPNNLRSERARRQQAETERRTPAPPPPPPPVAPLGPEGRAIPSPGGGRGVEQTIPRQPGQTPAPVALPRTAADVQRMSLEDLNRLTRQQMQMMPPDVLIAITQRQFPGPSR